VEPALEDAIHSVTPAAVHHGMGILITRIGLGGMLSAPTPTCPRDWCAGGRTKGQRTGWRRTLRYRCRQRGLSRRGCCVPWFQPDPKPGSHQRWPAGSRPAAQDAGGSTRPARTGTRRIRLGSV